MEEEEEGFGCRVARPVFCLPHNTAKTEGLKQSKVDLFNPAATLELLLLVICLSFASVQMAGAHWLVDAVNLSGTYHAVSGPSVD